MMVTAAARGYFDVTSERDETVSYRVNLTSVSCTCPDFRARRAEKTLDDPQRCCKHIRVAQNQPPTARENGHWFCNRCQVAVKAVVNPRGSTLSCPHCRHCDLSKEPRERLPQPTALEKAQAIAATLPDAELRRYAAEKQGTAAGCACWLALASRRAAELSDETLKDMFR